MLKHKKGVAAVPVIIAFALLILIIGYAWFKRNVEPVTVPSVAVSATSTSADNLKWSGQVPPGQFFVRTIDLGGRNSFDVTVTSAAAGASVVVRGANGEPLGAGGNFQTVSSVSTGSAGQVATHYHFDQNGGGAGGLWQVEVHNETGTTPADYEVVIPPPVNTTNTTSTITPTGQGINISITLQETINGQIVPVTGATVIAIITAPDGTVYTLPLSESASNPGTYTGYFGGNQQVGVYQITYQISGVNHDGGAFTQTADAEFLSTGLPPESTPGASDWTKIFDINLGNAIQLIGY